MDFGVKSKNISTVYLGAGYKFKWVLAVEHFSMHWGDVFKNRANCVAKVWDNNRKYTKTL